MSSPTFSFYTFPSTTMVTYYLYIRNTNIDKKSTSAVLCDNSLVIDVTNSGDGKSLMNAQLVRNMDSEPTTPVDQIKVKDKG